MNKNGAIFLSIVIALLIYITGVLFIPFFADDITTFRTDMNCSSPSTISYGTMLACLMGDALMPYFIWLFISLGLGYVIGSKS